MLWLPNPQAHEQPPAISDRSALALERVLLADDRCIAAAELCKAMLGDGWLVAWVQGWHGKTPRAIDHLASWWVERVPQWVETLAPHDSDHIWSWVTESQARSMAAAAIVAPRVIDPAHCIEWRVSSPDYVARVTQALRDVPQHHWLDDGDSEYREYLVVDDWVGWRLPRLVKQLRTAWGLQREFDSRLQSAKLDALKELAYGASHEINNPLANISGRAQVLLKQESEPHRRRILAAIDMQALRAHEMISDLMLFARPPRIQRETTDLACVVSSVLTELSDQLKDRRICAEVIDKAPGSTVELDKSQLLVAIRAIVENSLEAIGSGGKITIELAENAAAGGNDCLEVIVADTGRGIPQETSPHIFDPFFSGREAGRGLGFGLSKAWRIVTDHGGIVEFVDYPCHTTAFRIRLPLKANATLE